MCRLITCNVLIVSLLRYKLGFLPSLYCQNLGFMLIVLTLRVYLDTAAFQNILRANYQNKHIPFQRTIYVTKIINIKVQSTVAIFNIKSCNIRKVGLNFFIFFFLHFIIWEIIFQLVIARINIFSQVLILKRVEMVQI